MQVVHERCAGLDVHKKNVYGCIFVLENNGKKKLEVRSFSTMTEELLKLAEWLREYGVTRVAMEATGVSGDRYGPYSKGSSS
jgi:transposase